MGDIKPKGTNVFAAIRRAQATVGKGVVFFVPRTLWYFPADIALARMHDFALRAGGRTEGFALDWTRRLTPYRAAAMLRQAEAHVIAQLAVSSRSQRVEILRAITRLARDRGSFAGLESPFLTLATTLGPKVGDDVAGSGLSVWNELGAGAGPGDEGLGRGGPFGARKAIVFNLNTGELTSTGGPTGNLGFDPQGGLSIPNQNEAVSIGWGVALVALAVAAVITTWSSDAGKGSTLPANSTPEPSSPDAGSPQSPPDKPDTGGSTTGGAGSTPDPNAEGGAPSASELAKMRKIIDEKLQGFGGRVSDPTRYGENTNVTQAPEGPGLMEWIREIALGGYTDPAFEGTDQLGRMDRGTAQAIATAWKGPSDPPESENKPLPDVAITIGPSDPSIRGGEGSPTSIALGSGVLSAFQRRGAGLVFNGIPRVGRNDGRTIGIFGGIPALASLARARPK